MKAVIFRFEKINNSLKNKKMALFSQRVRNLAEEPSEYDATE